MKQKVYKVSQIDTYMNKLEDLHLVKELSKTKKEVQEQERIFIEKAKRHRATFYRYRKKLGIRAKIKPFKYKLKEIGICYFCLRKATEIHHINQNTKDNRQENLLPLCKGCHTKIHRVLVAKSEAGKSHNRTKKENG